MNRRLTWRFLVLAFACTILPPIAARAEETPAVVSVASIRRVCKALARWPPSRFDVLERIGARVTESERTWFLRFEWPDTPFSLGKIAALYAAEDHPDEMAFARRVAGREPSQWWFVNLVVDERRRPTVASLAQALGGTALYVPAKAEIDGWPLWFSWPVPGKDRGRCFVRAMAERDKDRAGLGEAAVLGFLDIVIVHYAEDDFARLAQISRYTPSPIR